MPGVRVGVWRVQPTIQGGSQAAQAVLRALLDHVHQTLSERVEVRCQGVFLDSLSVADAADLHDRTGQTLTRDDYAELFRDSCQGGKLRIGALNALLLAWQSEAH